MTSALRIAHLGQYARLGALLVKHGPSTTWRSIDEPDVPDDAADVADDEDAEALVDDLESMGPTFVKLGQMLSTRSDLLPPVYLQALARLQDDVEPFGFEEVERIVEEQLGARISKAFQSFDHEPAAAASLGQVHRAVLRDGRAVAVKVQRPGIRARVVDDLEVIDELASFVAEHTRFGRQLGFQELAREFRRSTMAELDYTKEAANLRLLGENLADLDRIVVPQPVDDYTTSTCCLQISDGLGRYPLWSKISLALDSGSLRRQEALHVDHFCGHTMRSLRRFNPGFGSTANVAFDGLLHSGLALAENR